MPIDNRPTLAAPDDDPYLWLEEVEGERALDFVERQSRLTLEKFGGPGFAADRDTLASIYDRPDNIPYVSRRGRFLYNLWKDANNPRGIWRRTTLEEFRRPNPAWEILLDVDNLAADENADWLWAGVQTLSATHPFVILSLSRGGSDATMLREFDIDTRTFVADGFVLPEAKSYAGWFDADTLLLSSAYGEGMATSSGYARTVRLWRRGTEVNRAPVIFETTSENMGAFSEVDRTDGIPRVWLAERLDFFNSNLWLGDLTGASVETRSSDACPNGLSPRLVCGEAAQALDGGSTSLRARHRPWHVAAGIPGGRTQFRDLVRSGTPPGGAALLLDRRQIGALDPRRNAAGF